MSQNLILYLDTHCDQQGSGKSNKKRKVLTKSDPLIKDGIKKILTSQKGDSLQDMNLEIVHNTIETLSSAHELSKKLEFASFRLLLKTLQSHSFMVQTLDVHHKYISSISSIYNNHINLATTSNEFNSSCLNMTNTFKLFDSKVQFFGRDCKKERSKMIQDIIAECKKIEKYDYKN